MFRGYQNKTIETLTEKQKVKFEKQFHYYKNSKRADPNMTEQGYLELLAKQANTFLIMGLILVPIYVMFVYAMYL